MSYISAVKKNNDVIVWERDTQGRNMITYPAPYYFYVEDPQGKHKSIYGDKLSRLDFSSSREFNAARLKCKDLGMKLFESDISPELKLLSEKYYNKPAPTLHVTLFDIEVDYDPKLGFSTIDNPYAPINSVAYYHNWLNKMVVHSVLPDTYDGELSNFNEEEFIEELNAISELPTDINIEFNIFENEKQLLLRMVEEIDDSDVIAGWNSDLFDTPYVGKRLELVLGSKYFNRLSFYGANSPKWRTTEAMGREVTTLDLSGRSSVDYMVLFKKYEMAERPSYKLESIADEILPDLPKLEYEGSLASLYRKNFPYFVRYNFRDTEILKGLEDRLGYIETANQMFHMSTGLFNHVNGTLKLTELATINYCHHELDGLVVNDLHVDEDSGGIQGATVLAPQVGMHENIAAVDIFSLYPSCIRSLNISPETIVGQFFETGKQIKTDDINCDMAPHEVPNACVEISKGSDHKLTFFDNNTDEKITKTASEWKDIFLSKGFAVSGFGTVFSQNKKGIIPSILTSWTLKRQEYQRLKKEYKDDKVKSTYYDKLQYVYKIKLNSFYGALNNKYFRFHDVRMGESTTAVGRMILIHQCAMVCKLLDGEYAAPDVISSEIVTDNKTKLKKKRWHYGYSDKWSVIYGDSVSGNTEIETNNGPQFIESLFNGIDYTKGEKEYSNCDASALTYNRETRRNEFRKIKYCVRHKVNKKMYRVWIGNTRYLDVTEDHSLIGYANSKHENPGMVEVKPSEVGTKNINSLILNAHLPQQNTINKKRLSSEMWQLVGLIIGDGHVGRKESGVELSVGAKDKEEIIRKVINPLIEQGWFTSIVHMKNGHDIRICGTRGFNLLRELLYYGETKQFPKNITDEHPDDIASVLRGYFSADGFANKNKTIGLRSVNIDFIKTANRLLKICGIPSNYWTEGTENSFNGKFSGTSTTRLTVYDAVVYGEKVGFIQDRKNKNVRTKYSRNTEHRIGQTGFSLITPTKIEEIDCPEYVYDIEVDETHTFYANDLLVHNTDSSYCTTHGTTTDQAIKIGDRIGELINDSFSEFMRTQFLCGEGYDNIIKTGREIIGDNGIFVDKKRYIIHVIDDEGDTVDKMKVMGLDTKKTTMPKHVAKQLNGFVERLLKGETWRDISVDIVALKTQIETEGDFVPFGLPKGIKGIEEYTHRYKMHDDTPLPGHIAAGIMYNLCREKYEDKESLQIFSGMKIKVFYLKQNIGRFKSIALPVDDEQTPKWFTEHFVPLIDRKAHITRLIDKPLSNIVKAVGLTVPNRQDLLLDDLFGDQI